MRLIKRISLIVIILLALIITFSYLFPGKIKFVDNVRLALQGPIMSTVGNIELGEVTIENGEVVESEIDITLEELYQFSMKMEPGDIFLTNTRRYASSSFIPGQWKHSGIYLGTKQQLQQKFGMESLIYLHLSPLMNDSSQYVLDSNSKGVHVHQVDELSNLNKVSYLIGFTSFSINADLPTQEAFLLKAAGYLEKPYDFDMVLSDDERLYCSELIFHALKSIDIIIDQCTVKAGRSIITPNDLFTYFVPKAIKGDTFIYRGCITKKDHIVVEHLIEEFYINDENQNKEQ
mgnify:CR=1 FL=1